MKKIISIIFLVALLAGCASQKNEMVGQNFSPIPDDQKASLLLIRDDSLLYDYPVSIFVSGIEDSIKVPRVGSVKADIRTGKCILSTTNDAGSFSSYNLEINVEPGKEYHVRISHRAAFTAASFLGPLGMAISGAPGKSGPFELVLE